MVCHLCKATRS